MTIFELPTLDPDEALRLVRRTLAAHPLLARFYDDAFIANLVRRRTDNVLVLRLVQPDDELNMTYWAEIVDDLLVLEADGGFEAFREKFRKQDGPSLESARTELFFAAWLRRNGIELVLEPLVGQRRCEFVAETVPRTWWEIKTPLDLAGLRMDAAVEMDVHRRLRRIEQPYVLSLERYDLTLQRVPAAVNAVKREIRAYYLAGGALPHAFEADGLVVNANSTTTRPEGYLGTMLGKRRSFRNENTSRVVRRIVDATNQIPREGGGIIVIDRSASDWIDHEDVEEACFGEERLGVVGDDFVNVRLPGMFDDDRKTRISAVVSYTRRWREDRESVMTFLHNPIAAMPLLEDFLVLDGVRHSRRVRDGNRFRLVTKPMNR